eukprot:GGOE01023353.1.p3 GENE.GGOE01023353.1~~GGOE01023353.1.p3  ORF type:complete len:106 (-),score=2.44 GGOE01023353.1:140-457(-)
MFCLSCMLSAASPSPHPSALNLFFHTSPPPSVHGSRFELAGCCRLDGALLRNVAALQKGFWTMTVLSSTLIFLGVCILHSRSVEDILTNDAPAQEEKPDPNLRTD